MNYSELWFDELAQAEPEGACFHAAQLDPMFAGLLHALAVPVMLASFQWKAQAHGDENSVNHPQIDGLSIFHRPIAITWSAR